MSDLSLMHFCECLFHNDLFDAHLCASGDAEEVDALGHVIDIDLFGALGFAAGHHLTHAVEHHIAVLGIATIDVERAADRVWIDAHGFEHALLDAYRTNVNGDESSR